MAGFSEFSDLEQGMGSNTDKAAGVRHSREHKTLLAAAKYFTTVENSRYGIDSGIGLLPLMQFRN